MKTVNVDWKAVTVAWKLELEGKTVVAGTSAGRNLEAAKLKAVVDCVAWAKAWIAKAQSPSPHHDHDHHQSRD
jgi:hypothetical protein